MTAATKTVPPVVVELGMWATIFSSITSAFRTANKVITAGEALADWANEEAKLLRDEATIVRIPRTAELQAAKEAAGLV